jgi:hypothetical protein
MLSPGQELLARARQVVDEGEVDRLAVAAIVADPDLAEAYLLRGEVAARQGDAVTAAHHFRVAWTRGDRSASTRAALAICFDVVGQHEAAAGMGAGSTLPPALETFGELARLMAPAIRGILALPLPPPGEPALLPGERRPSGVIPRIEAAALRPQTQPPTSRPSLPPAPRPLSSPPAPIRPISAPPAPITPPRAEVAIELEDFDAEPDWLETHHSRRTSTARSVARADWLEDSLVPMSPGEAGPRFAAVPLDLVVDPGPPEFEQRSPATGQSITPGEIIHDRAAAMMPALSLEGRFQPSSEKGRSLVAPSEPPRPVGPDPLETASDFKELGSILRLAIELPGPVITQTGAKPQQLCAIVALGLTADELLMRDRQRPEVAVVRLPLRALRRMDLLRDGAQLSFGLHDGRQLHLDLRALNTRAPSLTQMLVAELGVALKALGAQVNG